jgi:hypothetical protein
MPSTLRLLRHLACAVIVGVGTVVPVDAVAAATLVATPARGAEGATIKFNASGLAASTTYALEFVGSPATALGNVTSDPRGSIAVQRVLPALPVGSGKLRLKTTGLGGTVVAFTAFTALPPMGFVPPTGSIHAGQSITFQVTGLTPGTLSVLYEGEVVSGPVAVSQPTYRGKFAVPTDRPASLPANARVRVVNRAGRVLVAQLDTTMRVLPRLASPFQIGISQPPPTLPRREQRFRVAGTLDVAANESMPTDLSLWYFGTDGAVVPLGSGLPQAGAGAATYAFDSAAPGIRSMTAAQAFSGQTRVMGTSRDTFGRTAVRVGPNTTTFEPLPDGRWRLTVRVRTNTGAPIPGAIVQIEGAPVVDPDAGFAFAGVSTLYGLVQANSVVNQLSSYRATDAQGCPITLQRKIADNNGNVVFEFNDADLALLLRIVGGSNCEAGGECDLGSEQSMVQLAIDASAQGYGFQFTEGPTAGDFLPHRYLLLFSGTGNDDPGDDQLDMVDWYQQDVVVLSDTDRDATYTLALPPIVPKVAIFDVAIKPWVANSVAIDESSGTQGFGATRLIFGPINQLPTAQPYVGWLNAGAAAGYPTEITVRTDPAVTGAIPAGNAKFFLDMNRDGNPEQVGTFTPSNIALDCTIEGLDKSITWRATVPPALKNASGGLIKGKVRFTGATGAGSATQQIGVQMIDPGILWMAGSQYSQQSLIYSNGGQQVTRQALENTPDESVQLPNSPDLQEYEIGRLRNETNNTRLVTTTTWPTGNPFSSSAIDGTHMGAGRQGTPTMIASLEYGPVTTTLIDRDIPLFYYSWGIPFLASVEVGADFSLLAEITMQSRVELTAQKQPILAEFRTTPSLYMGLNFYIDLDVLLDLVDAEVNLDATFGLDMPIVIRNGFDESPDPRFDNTLVFLWNFDIFCFPGDLACYVAEAVLEGDGCERLLPTNDNRPCPPFDRAPASSSAMIADGRGTTPTTSQNTALAYSPDGAGFMAFTRASVVPRTGPSLIVRPIDGADFGRGVDETTLSQAPGIRSVALVFHDQDRAVAVWAENADPYDVMVGRTAVQRIARQRLMYSAWNGTEWSRKAALTPPSGGEGGVDLAACTPRSDARCPAGGEVLATWTRDTAGDITQHRTQVFTSRFTTARGWTTPQPLDGTALLDSAPSAAYIGASPVVAFVRNTNGVFADTGARRVAYRFLGAGSAVQLPAELPGGVAWPDIVATADGGFAIAHTYAADPRAFVGNRQRVAMAYGFACASGACTVVAQPVNDSFGRAIYGERPTALVDSGGNVSVVLRGMGFGPDTGGLQVRKPVDPIGMVLHTGELIMLNTARGQRTVTPVALSGDGAVHRAPSAALDPALGQVVVASTRGPAVPTSLRKKLEKAGVVDTAPSRAAGMALESDLGVYMAATGVDLAVESLTSSSTALLGGRRMTATARVRNVGADYVAASAVQRVALSFDAPSGAGGVELGSTNVGSLASGQSVDVAITFTVPAGYSPDESHRLYARLLGSAVADIDVDETNDQAELDFGGMPAVFGVHASAIPETRVVQLTWDAVPDPNRLLKGYRVWHHDGDGVWKHLGSSFVAGFLDLNAPVDTDRHYRVTSYSAKAIESPPGDEGRARGEFRDAVFGDGFEALAP